jgi:hypothetical protein
MVYNPPQIPIPSSRPITILRSRCVSRRGIHEPITAIHHEPEGCELIAPVQQPATAVMASPRRRHSRREVTQGSIALTPLPNDDTQSAGDRELQGRHVTFSSEAGNSVAEFLRTGDSRYPRRAIVGATEPKYYPQDATGLLSSIQWQPREHLPTMATPPVACVYISTACA